MVPIWELWYFFVQTNTWYWSLWSDWFSFFKGILPWVWSHDLWFICFFVIVYYGVGLYLTNKLNITASNTNGLLLQLLNKIWMTLAMSTIMPGLVVAVFVVMLPILFALLFYGVWLIVWCAAALVAFLYCICVWPIQQIWVTFF